MSNLASAGLVLGAMLVLIALRVPIGAAMFAAGAAGYWAMVGDIALLSYLKGLLWARLSVYDLSVIPLFLLMGQLASEAGFSRTLFQAANTLLGHRQGGVAMAAVVACAAFGSICGSSVATAATMSQVALPEMKRLRYSDRLSTGSLAVGGTLGILIPPSVILIIYALLAAGILYVLVKHRDQIAEGIRRFLADLRNLFARKPAAAVASAGTRGEVPPPTKSAPPAD